MKTIRKLYSELQNREATKPGFTSVSRLLSSEKFFLGVSDIGTPMFLIDCEFTNAIADSELEYISILYNKQCKIFDDSKREFLKTCSVIILNSNNYDFQTYFLEVIYLMVKNLPQNPTQEEIKNEIDKVIALFRCMSKPSVKTVQGLWAELFVIAQAKNPEYLIKAWHSTPRSKFDFNDGKDKVEVKSTSGMKRIHKFSLEQLNPNENSKLIVASVFTVETGIGKNINDLRVMIFSKINDTAIQRLVDSIIFETLGCDLEKAFDFYFDYQYAIDELCFFDAEKIPKIEKKHIPQEISFVNFSCDLSSISPLSKEKYSSSESLLFRSL